MYGCPVRIPHFVLVSVSVYSLVFILSVTTKVKLFTSLKMGGNSVPTSCGAWVSSRKLYRQFGREKWARLDYWNPSVCAPSHSTYIQIYDGKLLGISFENADLFQLCLPSLKLNFLCLGPSIFSANLRPRSPQIERPSSAQNLYCYDHTHKHMSTRCHKMHLGSS